MHARRINFDTFGDRTKASSRLRAWMLADQLQAIGFSATVNGALDVEVQVFQKRRDAKRLRIARANGARIVFDFDDNYLLDDVGAKDDVLAFMNQADVVTVGSRDLLERARRYHDHVILLENPLDVLPGSGAKVDFRWQGMLGWFGAPENQGILHSLGLRERVTTVTADGDIPWSLETIDGVLKQFDLVLLPVEADAWTLAKNANRLLKCVALGVPFLASKTPEHQLVADELGLPDWLLVEAGGNWDERIDEVTRRYAELAPLLRVARIRAFKHFGIASVTSSWLREIQGSQPAAPLDITASAQDILANVDVIVLGEDAPARALETMQSLCGSEVAYRSLSVISALPIGRGEALDEVGAWDIYDRHGDFFEIYDTLARVLARRGGAMTLLVQAGVETKRGFLHDIESLDPTAMHLFRGQLQRSDLAMAPSPPATLDQLICRPYRPAAVLLPNEAYRSSTGMQPRFGPLAIWELLIALVNCAHVPLHAVSTPLIAIAPELPTRTPLQSYAELLEYREPTIAADLPSLTKEWERLVFSLHAAVIEEHEELFRNYKSTIIPRLSGESLHVTGVRTEHQREREKTGRWIAQLREYVATEQPRLVQTQTGTIYLFEAGMKRHVTTWLIVRALEDLFGPLTKSKGSLDQFGDGPPVEILADTDGRLYLIAGGQRYPVRGLPVPLAASPERLALFPMAGETVDLYRGVKRAGVKPSMPSVIPAPPSTTAEPNGVGAKIQDTAQELTPVARHADTWVKPGKLGKNRRYKPTFGTLPFINDTHRRLLEAPLKPGTDFIDIGIPGSLRREDAAKLYELAYFSSGDLLVLGSAHELAATVVAQAMHDGGRTGRLTVVERDPRMLERARDALDAYGFGEVVQLECDNPVSFCRSRSGHNGQYDFVFIDNVPTRADIREICKLLPGLARNSGFVLFHDFNVRANGKADQGEGSGVYAAVVKSLQTLPFSFYGVFGTTALYRRESSPNR
jgi:predicted O-methyltransferase YrrM